MTEPGPRSLGRYQLQEEIGRGMMGVVYRAEDPVLGRTVALKTVHLGFAVADSDREMFERRFLAEARAAAALSHRGIVVVHDLGRDEASGTVYIALEFLQGRTLAQALEAGAGLDWRESLRIVGRVAEALDHAHRHGIVHRDIKPANIMLLPSGEPKIMDFGVAKVPASQLTTAGEFFGTPSYMSPEQASGETVDARSDIFSLGGVLYLLLTGRRAFDGPSVPAILAKVAQADPIPPAAVCPGLPPAVDYLVARSLAKSAADRYPNAGTFAEDVEDVREGRAPRHRAGWIEPARAEATRVSRAASAARVEATADQPGTLDLVAHPVEAAPRAPQTTLASPGPSRAADASAHATGEASLILRLSDRLGARGLLVVGGAAALVVIAALLLPRSTSRPVSGVARSAIPALPALTLVEPAHLELILEHPFKKGAWKVWIDDDLVLDQTFEGHVTTKVLSMRIHKGTAKQTVDVAPGEHAVKVQVEADGDTWSRRIRNGFESGQKRRLEVSMGNLLKKEMSLAWGS